MSRSSVIEAVYRPRRVFFDTNHLIDLVKVKRREVGARERVGEEKWAAHEAIIRAIENGAVVPVISISQVWEWCRPPGIAANGLEIATLLDTAPSCYVIEDLYSCFLLEIAREAMRLSGRAAEVPLPARDVGQPSNLMPWLIQHVASIREDWLSQTLLIPIPEDDRTCVGIVKSVCASIEEEGSVTRGEEHEVIRRAFELDRDTARKVKERAWATACERMTWIPQTEELIRSIGYPKSVEQLMKEVEPKRCPALALWARFWPRYVLGSNRVDPGGPTDISWLPGCVYSGYALVENRMRGLVHQASPELGTRVFSSPVSLIAELGVP